MKQFFRDYFTFNKRERNGIFVLLGILCLLFIWMGMQEMEFGEAKADFVEEHILLKADTGTKLTRREDTMSITTPFSEEKEHVPAHLFAFDPNTLDPTGWSELGLSNKQIHIIHNYLSKGGKFREKEDLKKVYGFREADYARLEPYIRIEQQKKEAENSAGYKSPESKSAARYRVILELNEADSAALEGLRCIGPGFAKRIITYRKILGGFHDLNQLHEVYGMDEERFNCLVSQIKVDSLRILKLNPNTASLSELEKHPYIRYGLAKLIIAYREQHGPYKQMGDLRKLKLLKEDQLRQLLPYLTLD